jgi:hypothetical protein
MGIAARLGGGRIELQRLREFRNAEEASLFHPKVDEGAMEPARAGRSIAVPH